MSGILPAVVEPDLSGGNLVLVIVVARDRARRARDGRDVPPARCLPPAKAPTT